MNQQAVEIMREALEKITSIHKPTNDSAEKYELEELLEKLDFAVITARNALDRAAMPGECQKLKPGFFCDLDSFCPTHPATIRA